ncbi:MAG: hypothetical protein ACT4O9_16085 [Blastocatellia bacterium]
MRLINPVLVFSIALIAIGCGSNATTPKNGNTVNNTAANVPPTGPITEPTKRVEAATTNNAPTLTPVVHAYYDALKKKDDAAVRTLITAEFLKSVEADMKEENRKDLAGFMAEYDTIPEKPVEVRNEKIDGDKAEVEIKGGAYPNWTPFGFAKESGTWRFTGKGPDIDRVDKKP